MEWQDTAARQPMEVNPHRTISVRQTLQRA